MVGFVGEVGGEGGERPNVRDEEIDVSLVVGAFPSSGDHNRGHRSRCAMCGAWECSRGVMWSSRWGAGRSSDACPRMSWGIVVGDEDEMSM
jgi:hypothetical protein